MPASSNTDLILLTGQRGAGKTSLLEKLVEGARQARCTVSGLLTLPRMAQQQKTGLEALDLRSGTRRLLASRIAGELNGPQMGDWTFAADALDWGNNVIKQISRCDLIILDEIGPLEFDRHQGWTSAFELLANPLPCRLAIIVVRPKYADIFLQRFSQARTVTIRAPEEIDRLARQILCSAGL
jgi:nucleoside-triphosphatase